MLCFGVMTHLGDGLVYDSRGRRGIGAAPANGPRRSGVRASGAVRGRPLRRRHVRAGHRRVPVRLPRRHAAAARRHEHQGENSAPELPDAPSTKKKTSLTSFVSRLAGRRHTTCVQYKSTAEAALDAARVILRQCEESRTVNARHPHRQHAWWRARRSRRTPPGSKTPSTSPAGRRSTSITLSGTQISTCATGS